MRREMRKLGTADALPSPRERSEWRGPAFAEATAGEGACAAEARRAKAHGGRRLLGANNFSPPRLRSKRSPPTPSAFASLMRPTLPATKPGPARVWHQKMRKSGRPDLRGREGDRVAPSYRDRR